MIGLARLTLIALFFGRDSAWLFQQTPARPPTEIAQKSAFYKALSQGVAQDASLSALLEIPTQKPCSEDSLVKFSKGKWNVCYAPHIRILEKITLTTFDVFYEFYEGSNIIRSYVRYESPIFRCGWLNTLGKVERVSDDVCRVVWGNIWLDFNSIEQGPTAATETRKHVLPQLIQAIGERSFIEGVSRFPVKYLDSDLCVFQFQVTGTVVCARRT